MFPSQETCAAVKFLRPHRALISMQSSSRRSLRSRACLILAGLSAVLCCARSAFCDAPVPIRVPEGFEVTLFADDDLAHDVYSMTIDSLGRVVVSSAGYVRILIDSDNDGRADKFQQYADGPATGSQGMFFVGRDLICTGDDGLIRYRDQNNDDRADGPPDVFLKFKTGGEHHSHSIQKGPDGWWYVIAGNECQINSNYVTLATSPVKNPRAGVLMRLKPDLSGGEIVADGFRNAYDFAFGRHGDIFTYDSDDERDVSLPWYRPTRVFHVVPGSHAGWITKSWKRPDYFADMPPVVAEFGRGSPTGVICYQHRQFPEVYDGALFVLDWTFGRVMAVPLKEQGGTWSSEPIEFMKGTDQYGFAPTDAEVGPDGCLYVSVGGRGTKGSVFKVKYKGSTHPLAEESEAQAVSADEKLLACLDAPQPLSSWSRAIWEPLAKELGRDRIVAAFVDPKLSSRQRVRAIEILTEMYGGLDKGLQKALASDESADVRAATVWSVGRMDAAVKNPAARNVFLNDKDAVVRRAALESLLGADTKSDLAVLFPVLVKCLDDADDRVVRLTASRVVARLSPEAITRLIADVKQSGTLARLSLALGVVNRPEAFNRGGLAQGLAILCSDSPVQVKTDAARLMQLALGDVGPHAKRAAVLHGYAPRLDLDKFERELDRYRVELAKLYPTGESSLDHELARLLAMLAPSNRKLLDRVLAKITEQSHPVDDIHQLIVAARIPVEFDSAQRKAIAKGLVGIDAKIQAGHLNQDTNWDDRFGELYQLLAAEDPLLPVAIAEEPGFGRPSHVLFMSQFPKELLAPAIEAFVRNIKASEDYSWTNDVVFLLGESDVARHRAMVREQYENHAVQNAVLMVLAERPEADDREKFVHGLESSQVEVLAACLDALQKLPESRDADEMCALVLLLRRLGDEKQDAFVREKVVKLLERNSGQRSDELASTGEKTTPAGVVDQWIDWVKSTYPEAAAKSLGDTGDEADLLRKQLAEVDWSAGDLERGKGLFEKQSCARCHGGRKALGPDLAGAARRFSRDDLFVAIAIPSRDVSPRYHTTTIQTNDGRVHSGLIVYESVDGVILRNATGQTFRIEGSEIELRRRAGTSLMPGGLLKGLSAADLADLYVYLSSLGAETSKTAAAAQIDLSAPRVPMSENQ
jgi:putative membrane-bound dehydrogenase-like protein